VKFALIDAEKAHFPIDFMCVQFGLSRSGFYAWKKRKPSLRTLSDAEVKAKIRDLHEKCRGTYGSPRMQAALKREGLNLSRKRVARLMREENLAARRKRSYRRTTDSKHAFPIADNVLARSFDVAAPNTVWATDITYIDTREGWLYLAAILDLHSRRVVGWAMSKNIDRQLCLDALLMALRARRPPPGLVHHSDRGSQYASTEYRKMLAANGIVCSMSRKGDCWDNAVAESFWSSLKTELVDRVVFLTRAAATAAIFEYIEVFYNRQRLHSHLGYCSPAEFESLDPTAAKAA
jgi:putative transposase